MAVPPGLQPLFLHRHGLRQAVLQAEKAPQAVKDTVLRSFIHHSAQTCGWSASRAALVSHELIRLLEFQELTKQLQSMEGKELLQVETAAPGSGSGFKPVPPVSTDALLLGSLDLVPVVVWGDVFADSVASFGEVAPDVERMEALDDELEDTVRLGLFGELEIPEQRDAALRCSRLHQQVIINGRCLLVCRERPVSKEMDWAVQYPDANTDAYEGLRRDNFLACGEMATWRCPVTGKPLFTTPGPDTADVLVLTCGHLLSNSRASETALMLPLMTDDGTLPPSIPPPACPICHERVLHYKAYDNQFKDFAFMGADTNKRFLINLQQAAADKMRDVYCKYRDTAHGCWSDLVLGCGHCAFSHDETLAPCPRPPSAFVPKKMVAPFTPLPTAWLSPTLFEEAIEEWRDESGVMTPKASNTTTVTGGSGESSGAASAAATAAVGLPGSTPPSPTLLGFSVTNGTVVSGEGPPPLTTTSASFVPGMYCTTASTATGPPPPPSSWAVAAAAAAAAVAAAAPPSKFPKDASGNSSVFQVATGRPRASELYHQVFNPEDRRRAA